MKSRKRVNKRIYLLMGFAIACVIGIFQWGNKDVWVSKLMGKEVIVIDPGHGGFDPGKVGVNQAVEKDINLSISLKLKSLLEAQGYEIIMTREIDEALHEEGSDKTSKQMDMRKRVEVINNSNAVVAVSIHQNSFTQSSSHGAQVFYYPLSKEAENLALLLQAKIKEEIADDNHREAKSNDSYYMLKKTTCPLVIVECGFLSNYDEAQLLISEEYQEKMANAIQIGIMDYIKQVK